MRIAFDQTDGRMWFVMLPSVIAKRVRSAFSGQQIPTVFVRPLTIQEANDVIKKANEEVTQ